MDANGLLMKVKGLGKSTDWVHNALLVLDSKSDLLKLAVFTATNEDAVALVDKMLAGECPQKLRLIPFLPVMIA
jgi:hypothetical protein